MKKRKPRERANPFIPLSDMMTGLMVVFLFIAVSYMLKLKAEQRSKDQVVTEFRDAKLALYEELRHEFAADFLPGRWNAELSKDLSIRFINDKVHFDFNRAELKDEFKAILSDFFPRYSAILLKEKYKRNIAEVRIEGHTDSVGNYFYNMFLSQQRTGQVLHFLLADESSIFGNLLPEDQRQLRYWLTATGYSSGRTLDLRGQDRFVSGGEEDGERSRRVEFRVITSSDALVDLLGRMTR